MEREIPTLANYNSIRTNSFLSEWKKKTGLGLKIIVVENEKIDVDDFNRNELENILERPRIVVDRSMDKNNLPFEFSGHLVVPTELEHADIDQLSELDCYQDLDFYVFPFVKVHILNLVFLYPNTKELINYDPWSFNYEKYIQTFDEAKKELYDFLCEEYEMDPDVCKIRHPIDCPSYVIDKTVGSIDRIEYSDKKEIRDMGDPNKVIVSSYCTSPSFLDVYVTRRGSRVEQELKWSAVFE